MRAARAMMAEVKIQRRKSTATCCKTTQPWWLEKGDTERRSMLREHGLRAANKGG
jgi:hypothetical protein